MYTESQSESAFGTADLNKIYSEFLQTLQAKYIKVGHNIALSHCSLLLPVLNRPYTSHSMLHKLWSVEPVEVYFEINHMIWIVNIHVKPYLECGS